MSLTLRLPVAGEDCLAECCKGQAAKDLCINGSERWLLKYPADCHRVRARARTKNHVGSGLTKATGTGLGDRRPCSLNTGWSGRGEAAEVAGASPPTPHLPDLLRKMRIGCLETGRHEELCVPERLHSDVGIVVSSWDRIYGRVGHARPTVWGSTIELGREGEAGGRGEAKCLWKGRFGHACRGADRKGTRAHTSSGIRSSGFPDTTTTAKVKQHTFLSDDVLLLWNLLKLP